MGIASYSDSSRRVSFPCFRACADLRVLSSKVMAVCAQRFSTDLHIGKGHVIDRRDQASSKPPAAFWSCEEAGSGRDLNLMCTDGQFIKFIIGLLSSACLRWLVEPPEDE